jgi:GNAT superfamily N-acetyltransferase
VSTATRVRAATADDREPLRRFLTGLSPLCRYQRFFTGAACHRDRDLDVLLCAGGTGGAVVAVDRGEVVGHAMWAPTTAAPGVADVGVVVGDRHRRRGLGTRLLLAVVADAQRAGLHTLEALVLPDNLVMHGMVRDLAPQAAAERDDDLVRYRIPLAGSRRSAA